MELMERCRRIDADRRSLRERIQRWWDVANRMGGGSYDLSGVHGGSGGDRMADIMGELDQAERSLQRREREYQAEIVAVNALLEPLPDLDQAIMHRYYISGDTLSAIATGLGYSYGYVRVRKSAACSRLEQLTPQKVARLLPGWYFERHNTI